MAALRDPAQRIDLLSSLLAEWPGSESRVVDCDVSILSYLPARRCVALLDLIVKRIGSGAVEHRCVVAKLYSADQDPAAISATLQSLQDHGFGSGQLSVPRVLGFDPRWRMLVTERAPGIVLRRTLQADAAEPSLIERAADWLLKLHTCGLRTGRAYTFDRHLYTLGTWQTRLDEALPGAGRLFADALGEVQRLGRQLAGWQSAPTHRDFSPEHLVLDGERVSGLDLDEFCQYDPLFDVGHFVVHLRLLGLVHFGAAHHFDQLAERFQHSYAARAPDYSAERVRLYLAVTSLKLAFISACVTRPPGWQQIATTLLLHPWG